MQKRNHTPGPWGHYHDKLRPQFPTLIHEIHGPNGERVVLWGGFDTIDLPKQEIAANARLIAAAPDLLDAVQAFLDAAPSNGNRCVYCNASVYGSYGTDEHSPECEIEKGNRAMKRAKGRS